MQDGLTNFPHSARQNSFSLFEMMKVTKAFINLLVIRPDQISRYLPLNDPVVQELFETYLRSSALVQPDLQDLFCKTLIIRSYTCKPPSRGAAGREYMSLDNRKDQVDFLYHKALTFATRDVLQAVPRVRPVVW